MKLLALFWYVWRIIELIEDFRNSKICIFDALDSTRLYQITSNWGRGDKHKGNYTRCSFLLIGLTTSFTYIFEVETSGLEITHVSIGKTWNGSLLANEGLLPTLEEY